MEKRLSALTDWERGYLEAQLVGAMDTISQFKESRYVYGQGTNGYIKLTDCIDNLRTLILDIKETGKEAS